MKGTKYKAGGVGMKSTKGFAKGGAALRSEMQANPGMGNMPKSIMMKLGGAVKGGKVKPKGMKKGGIMKSKGYKKGGKVGKS